MLESILVGDNDPSNLKIGTGGADGARRRRRGSDLRVSMIQRRVAQEGQNELVCPRVGFLRCGPDAPDVSTFCGRGMDVSGPYIEL